MKMDCFFLRYTTTWRIVTEACRSRRRETCHWVLIFCPFESCTCLTLRLLSKLKQRFRLLIVFFKKPRETLELLLFLFSAPCWSSEQMLRKFSTKEIMGDEGKVEKEIFNYSNYKVKLNAFEWTELRIQVFGSLVIMTISNATKVCEPVVVYSRTNFGHNYSR